MNASADLPPGGLARSAGALAPALTIRQMLARRFAEQIVTNVRGAWTPTPQQLQ
jgi:hypothetical protein